MANVISRTYRNAVWANEAKDKINCEIVVNLDDGSSQVFEAVVSQTEQGNPDWDAILEKFGEEAIDSATTEELKQKNLEREKRAKENEERVKRESEFKRQEDLFAIKLEAFEIEEVKNSVDRTLKAKIRKAKTALEVQAYTTILLMKELENATTTEEADPAAE